MGITRRHIYSLAVILPAAYWAFAAFGPKLAQAQDPVVAIEPRVAARPESKGSANRTTPNIRVDSNLVLIPVMVTDHQDRLITGLEKIHFHLFDDKVEQEITTFASEDVPVSIVIVFDCSGSMGPKLAKSRAAVAAFLSSANPEDEFSLVLFNDRAQLVSGFNRQTDELQSKLFYAQSKGRTALLDAIYLAMDQMKHAKHSRKAVLVISDGGDNCSRYSMREVKNRVKEGDAQIYSIGILEAMGFRGRSAEELAGPALLDDIASQSGGRLFEIDNLNELSDVASKIGMALRNQYMLGFAPAEDRRDGKYHRVVVKLESPKGLPKLRASFRSGYFAPGQ
uniref:von Willebrand factor, type A n=1 Tax=Solibacter usitatus (strain Ellin6076) TaxID=234267 RepID=Q021L5_SOLUE